MQFYLYDHSRNKVATVIKLNTYQFHLKGHIGTNISYKDEILTEHQLEEFKCDFDVVSEFELGQITLNDLLQY
ncbi:hypothetical protein [Staphylococcus nepalensis]|uniref:hypothetical protein n=1 Tax=Staphylococcus nepalensis TaxID=214473 RepID=UPI0031BA6874